MAFPQFLKNTDHMGVDYAPFINGALVVAGIGVLFFSPVLIYETLLWLFVLSPLWMPFGLFVYFWRVWIQYIRAKFIAGQNPILLEIKIPRHVYKTPKAMEEALTGMNVGPGETTFIARWWNGKVRPWWSLEIVAIEGKVHFYLWCWAQYREFVESQLYAQFPNIEIHEVEDYTSGVKYDPNINEVWGMEYRLSKPDEYPIKTYIDFELDQEEKKAQQVVDPISGVFEKMSTFKQGEMLWVQIMVRQNKGAPQRSPLWWPDSKKWQDEAKELIQKLYDDAKPTVTDAATGSEVESAYPLLQPAQVNVIKALERSIEKSGFDTGMRAVYITKKGEFKGYKIAPQIVNLFATFKSGHLNGFAPSGNWHVSIDYPWQDPFGKVTEGFSKDIIDAYHRRSYFHEPYRSPRFVLTPEELATIYHFPTEETKAPGIERIDSTKAEPPANLPT